MYTPASEVHAVASAAQSAGGSAAAWALEWLAELLAAPGSQAAAQALLRGLAQRHGFDHARLGWRDAGDCALAAAWDSDAARARAPGREAVEAALDEAADQACAVNWPAPPPAGLGGMAPVSLALRALCPGPESAAMCIPLALADQPGRVVGAVCLIRHERQAQPLSGAAAELEHLLALAAPVLMLKRERERTLRQLARQRIAGALRALRAPEGGKQRRRWAAGSAALLALTAFPVAEHVGGQARVEGAEQRVLAAPADGFLKAAHALPGDRVKAGQVLADLAEQDLKLERDKWASQLAQHENAYAAAMARADREGRDGRAEAAVALARSQEAQAQLSLVGEQLQRAQLTAPFDGILIQGDLSQQIGAPVHQGDPLMTVASTQRYRVIVQVDERDIAKVRVGQRGVLSLSALPWDTLKIKVLRITPLAQVVEAGNVFEVQAELDEPVAAGSTMGTELRPGLQGQAKLVVGRKPWLWGVVQPWVQRAWIAVWGWVG